MMVEEVLLKLVLILLDLPDREGRTIIYQYRKRADLENLLLDLEIEIQKKKEAQYKESQC